jgi:hypothetical protein
MSGALRPRAGDFDFNFDHLDAAQMTHEAAPPGRTYRLFAERLIFI